VLVGELGFDGRIRPVSGVLPAAAAAAAAGFGAVVVAEENAAEAALVPELRVIAAPRLATLTAWIRNGRWHADPAVQVLEPGRDLGGFFGARREVAAAPGQPIVKDLSDLVGQPVARRAAEICAAGGHHLMLL
jgi:magnesium chelatase family protein